MCLTRYDIRYILDFLIDLFDQGLQCNTVGSYRTAIFAFYNPIEGAKIGNHPRVSLYGKCPNAEFFLVRIFLYSD